jgi:predicted Rossmann fold nucleotide-binding protein DprA/Smf involved in DNA uptake
MERTIELQANEIVVALSNGMLVIEDAATSKSRSIFVH